MLAIADEASVTPQALAERPYLELAFFWGPEWGRYVDGGGPLDALRPEQGNQHGRFYLAIGAAAPVFTFDSIPGPGTVIRRVEPQAVEILARHGIPTGLEATSPATTPFSRVPASTHIPPASSGAGWTWLAGGVGLLLLIGTAIARRKHWR